VTLSVNYTALLTLSPSVVRFLLFPRASNPPPQPPPRNNVEFPMYFLLQRLNGRCLILKLREAEPRCHRTTGLGHCPYLDDPPEQPA
jgi:hypothetical protein